MSYAIGSTYPFQWRDINDTAVDIQLSRDGGAFADVASSVSNTFDPDSETYNLYNWTVTEPIGEAVMKVFGHTNTADSATASTFSIVVGGSCAFISTVVFADEETCCGVD